jgi:hypothetical protein
MTAAVAAAAIAQMARLEMLAAGQWIMCLLSCGKWQEGGGPCQAPCLALSFEKQRSFSGHFMLDPVAGRASITVPDPLEKIAAERP